MTWHKQWAPLVQLKGFRDWVLGWPQGWACSQVMAQMLPSCPLYLLGAQGQRWLWKCLEEPTPQEKVSSSDGHVMQSWAGCHKRWQNSMMRGQNHCDPRQPFPKHCPLGVAKIQHPALGRRNPQGWGVAHLEAGMIWDYTRHSGLGDKASWRSDSPVLAGVTSRWLVPKLQAHCHIADG